MTLHRAWPAIRTPLLPSLGNMKYLGMQEDVAPFYSIAWQAARLFKSARCIRGSITEPTVSHLKDHVPDRIAPPLSLF